MLILAATIMLAHVTPSSPAPSITIALQDSSDLPGEGRQITILPVAWLKPLKSSFKEFRKTHANYDCYRIIITPRGEVLEVTFSSPLVTSEDKAKGQVVIGPALKCGSSATYFVGMDGRIVQPPPR